MKIYKKYWNFKGSELENNKKEYENFWFIRIVTKIRIQTHPKILKINSIDNVVLSQIKF